MESYEERYAECGDPFADDFNDDMALDLEEEFLREEMEMETIDLYEDVCDV